MCFLIVDCIKVWRIEIESGRKSNLRVERSPIGRFGCESISEKALSVLVNAVFEIRSFEFHSKVCLPSFHTAVRKVVFLQRVAERANQWRYF